MRLLSLVVNRYYMTTYWTEAWAQIAYILDKVFTNLKNSNAPAESSGDSISLYFESIEIPNISIIDYITHLHLATECSDNCFIIAFIYIDRLLERNPSFALSAKKMHRLVLSAIVLGIKYLDDAYASNKVYAEIGGVSVIELNFLEQLLISLLEFDLYVDAKIYYTYCQEITFRYQKLKEQELNQEMVSNNSKLQEQCEKNGESNKSNGTRSMDEITILINYKEI